MIKTMMVIVGDLVSSLIWFNKNIEAGTIITKIFWGRRRGKKKQISIWGARQEPSKEQLQVKIQTHAVLHACFSIVNIPALRRTVSVTAAHPWRLHQVVSCQQWQRVERWTVTAKVRVTLDGGGDPPQGQRTPIDWLLMRGAVAPVEPAVAVPCGISHRRMVGSRRAEPVVHESIYMGVSEATMDHSWLEVEPLCMLALSLVRVLVSS